MGFFIWIDSPCQEFQSPEAKSLLSGNRALFSPLAQKGNVLCAGFRQGVGFGVLFVKIPVAAASHHWKGLDSKYQRRIWLSSLIDHGVRSAVDLCGGSVSVKRRFAHETPAALIDSKNPLTTIGKLATSWAWIKAL
jgi:hypothetical protein